MKIQYYTLSRYARKTLDFQSTSPKRYTKINWPFNAWLLRPYLNLSPLEQGPIHSHGIEAAYHQLVTPDYPVLPLQSHPSCILRQTIIQENHLHQFTVHHPKDLANHLRTDRWQHLVKSLEGYADLSPEQQIRLITLLAQLSFYQLIVDLIPADINTQIRQDRYKARLAAKRCIAIHKLTPGKQSYLETLREIALHTPEDHRVRLLAATALVVYYGRNKGNSKKITYWAEVSKKNYQSLHPEKDWRDTVYASMYWRAVAFVPFANGNQQATVEYLDRAEQYAYAVKHNTKMQKIVRDENLHPLLETRRKEAIWQGNFALAYERARALVKHDPFDPKVYIQLGDVLLSQNNVEKALKIYRRAASLGAPYTPFSWFMIGHCEERLGNLEAACHAYQNTLKIDPWSVTAAKRLIKVSRKLHDPTITKWAEDKLAKIGTYHQSTP